MGRMTSVALFAAIALAACGKPEPVSEPVMAEEPAPPPAPAPGFTVDELSEFDGDIGGCTTMLGRPGEAGYVFTAEAGDVGARGFMRINGELIEVRMPEGGMPDAMAHRFESASGDLRIVETTVPGEEHPESDSVDMSGTLDVTWKGETQIIQVEGGVAC